MGAPATERRLPTLRQRPLPRLMDCRTIMDELGVKRSVAEAIMRAVPKQMVPGVRRMFVRRHDVQAYMDKHKVAA